MSATILVIAAPPELGELLGETLSAAGYHVPREHEYRFDLHQIASQPPELIVLDLAPGEETRGWQQVQLLKLRPATATIPLLVCTMQKTLVEELEGYLLTLGIGCMLKPFAGEQLLRALRQTLAAQGSAALPPSERA